MMVNFSGYPELDSDIGPSELSDIAEEPEEGLTDDSDDDRMTPHFPLPSQRQQQQQQRLQQQQERQQQQLERQQERQQQQQKQFSLPSQQQQEQQQLARRKDSAASLSRWNSAGSDKNLNVVSPR
jgi:hypothetical protein